MLSIQVTTEMVNEPHLKTSPMARINFSFRGKPNTVDEQTFCSFADLVVCNASNCKPYIGEYAVDSVVNRPKQTAGRLSHCTNYFYEVFVGAIGPNMTRVLSTNREHLLAMSTPGIPMSGPPLRQISLFVPTSHWAYWTDWSRLKNPKALHALLDEIFNPHGFTAIEANLGYDDEYQLTYLEHEYE